MIRKRRSQTDPDPNPDGGEETVGISCSRCGCRHLDVYYTRPREKYILRCRLCRNCGRKVITREKVQGGE